MDFALNLVALAAWLCLHAFFVLANRGVHSDEIVLEWKQIFVNVLDGGPTFSLTVELDETIADLSRDINELEGIPFVHMTTKIGDTLLDFSRKLSDYNIGDHTIVSVEMPSNLGLMSVEFYVRALDGRELQVTTQLDNTVASLKDNITQWTGIPQVEQRLLLKGKELKDERKLVHYHIDIGTVLNLGRPLEYCRQVASIVVRTLSGARIEVEVNLADTVTGLKEKIWEKTGVPVGVQHLCDNVRMITGEDHLCDLGLEAGSTVYMILYSSRLTSFNQVARLREPPVSRLVDPYKAPIFREVEDVGESVQSPAVLFKDARNWVVCRHRPSWTLDLFDPIARLRPDPDHETTWVEQYRRYTEAASRPSSGELYRIEAAIERARVELGSAVRPYRLAANLTSQSRSGITLGGGSSDVDLKRPPFSLGADVNNWAPDAFSDSDVMRLFEVSKRVRQALARAAQTGEGILSITSQRRINRAILFTYHLALANYRPAVEYNQASEGEECGICRDELTAEPAVALTCGHVFHADCILSWAANLIQEFRSPECPFCRQLFMLPYESLGKAELATPELQGNYDE